MSSQSWFWLLLGLFVIYRIYRKALDKNRIDITIKVYSEPGTPKKVANSAKPRLAKLQKELFALVALLSAALYTLVVTNLSLNYLGGWFVLGIFGIVISFLFLKSETLPTLALLEAKESGVVTDFLISEENLQTKRLSSARNTSLVIVIISLVISGNWAYEVQKNQSAAKLSATNEVMKIVGTGWCSNFWDIDANPGPDGDYIVNKSGGWPCISVGSVSNIYFTTEGRNQKMCFNYSLTRSDGPPSQSNSVSDYDFGSTCSLDSWLETGEGWDEDSLWSKVRKEANIEFELNKLQNVMCQNYYYGMSYEEQNVYC